MRHAITGILAIVALVLAAPLFSGSLGCSGKSDDPATLEEAFLDYNQVDTVRFKLSGDAKCQSCDPDEVASLYLELVSRLSPTSNLTVGTFDGLGSFHFPNLMAVADSPVDIYAILFFKDRPDSAGLRAEATFQVPDEEGETAVVTINFGQ